MYKNKKNSWLTILCIFSIAFGLAFLSRIYLSNIFKEKSVSGITRLAYETSNDIIENDKENNSETIIDESMKSVVGISKLQANEESLFDISLSQKWGFRYRDNSIT